MARPSPLLAPVTMATGLGTRLPVLLTLPPDAVAPGARSVPFPVRIGPRILLAVDLTVPPTCTRSFTLIGSVLAAAYRPSASSAQRSGLPEPGTSSRGPSMVSTRERRPTSQQRGKERAGAQLGDLDRQVTGGRRDQLVAGAVALRRAGLGALMWGGADLRGRLRVDQRLQHGVQQPAHHFAAISAAQCVGQLEQGQTDPGPSCESSSVSSLAGSHKASRGGPSTSVTDTITEARGPICTTPGDSPVGAVGAGANGVVEMPAGPGMVVSDPRGRVADGA